MRLTLPFPWHYCCAGGVDQTSSNTVAKAEGDSKTESGMVVSDGTNRRAD
ncbi:MAG: hypothetical protein IPK97_10275 [Ahniella sp.]|nr:hypothetical protein [Ahniella sp.]